MVEFISHILSSDPKRASILRSWKAPVSGPLDILTIERSEAAELALMYAQWAAADAEVAAKSRARLEILKRQEFLWFGY